jgi:hypothetical protein
MAITDRGAAAVRFALITVAVLAVQMLTAPPARAATLAAEPSSGPPGSTVGIRGEGFSPLQEVRLCWDHERCRDLGGARPGPDGAISVTIQIPADAGAGSHAIVACQRLLFWSCDSTGFEVVAPTTTTTSTTTTTTTTPPTTTTTAAPAATTTQPPTTTQPSATVTTGSPASTAPDSTAEPPASDPAPESEGVTTTSIDDEVLAAPGLRPPDDRPRLPLQTDPTGSMPEAREDNGGTPAVDAGGNDLLIASLAAAGAGVILWGADRLIKGDRRRYMPTWARNR